MNTIKFQELIQAATGRKLTFRLTTEEIPLEAKTKVFRDESNYESFVWTTPKNEDSLLRSFLTAFASKYREPDPKTYDNWEAYKDRWENPATRNESPCWNHHATHMLSPARLKAQVEANFANFTSEMAWMGFYPTNYGIGLFTLYGGPWVRDALKNMSDHLKTQGISFTNELSDKNWVTRFVIGLEKSQHTSILGGF